MGDVGDLHSAHWHGNTVTQNGIRTDEYKLQPGGVVSTDMVPDSPGQWFYHCHLNVHFQSGMAGKLPMRQHNTQRKVPWWI
jgi:FtsP/CotA-like multicopper oxidase with cupredoxin domain